jgi:hypothetical protein
MLTKRVVPIIVALLVVGICIAMIAAYLYVIQGRYAKGYPSDPGDFNEIGAYRFESSKTLIDLNNGIDNILTPVPHESLLQSPRDKSQVKWSFSDYLKVANAVKRQTWQDEMKDWSVYGMDFYTGCNDSLNGFSFGDFIYFKPAITETGNAYETREIWISPQQGQIEWGAGNYYPKPLFGWRKIDLNKVISADDALQIAENNGGKSARQKVSNICDIFLSYNPNINSNNWILTMSHNNELPNIFEIQVNPYNGKFNVIK